VGKIVKWSWAFNCAVGTAALLLPPAAAPDSHLQTRAGNAVSSATAQVNFKIIIPRVLYLHVAGANEGAADSRTVDVMSNNHNVALTATTRTPAGSAAARKIIAQDAVCMPSASAHRGIGPGNRVLCTASMP
jgi:hypothetical protein